MAQRKQKKQQAPQDSTSQLFKNVQPINPLTENQASFVESTETSLHQLLLGYPGTGKTYLALHAALLDLKNFPDKYRKIIIVRSPIQTTQIGHTPGTVQEKAAMYEGPYPSLVNKICKRGDAYEILKKKGIIEFELTTFLRGDTFDNAIIIVDEVQNLTAHSADTVLTRTGRNSKLIMCGDIQQRDLTRNSERDIEKFLTVVGTLTNRFNFTYFTVYDIVRSGLVSDYIKAKCKLFEDGY